MDNAYYAQVLEEIAALMQIKGESRFRVRAFEQAARAVSHEPEAIDLLMERGELTTLDGVGKGIARDIEEIARTGTCSVRTALLEELDPGLLEMMRIQGLGAKRIKLIYDELGVGNLEGLKKAIDQDKLQSLHGFGPKLQAKILEDIERLTHQRGRMPQPAARRLGAGFLKRLRALDGVERVELAGSLRRHEETVGDVDLLVAASGDTAAIMEAFIATPGVARVLVQGEKKTSVQTVQGIQVDLRVVRPQEFGSALHYFTGSKEHHVKLRTRAKQHGLKISEYGVFRHDEDTPIACATEHDVFEALGLPFIPPELRQGFDEIERAQQGTLPQLVTLEEIRGDVHMHTLESDGEASILEMAEAAKALGYEYIVITDHSQVLTVAHGMTPSRFAAHIEAIRQADQEIEGFSILSGIEVDILKDGTLDMDHDLLRECDWVIASVHVSQKMEPAAMTTRLLRAVDTGLISALGHPTGRILGGRAGYVYDMPLVLEACREKRVAVEINGSTGRLDFNATHARLAHQMGVAVVLGSDAHSTRGLRAMPYAVGQARRAGLETKDVLNARGAEALLASVR